MRRALPVLAVVSAAVAVLPSAAAADTYPCNVTRQVSPPPEVTLSTIIPVFHPNGSLAGKVYWNADPADGYDFNQDGVTDPGDALLAFDGTTDGCGIEAVIPSIGRTATTRGHNAPYLSPWASGNLPEDSPYMVEIYIVKGNWSYLAAERLVYS